MKGPNLKRIWSGNPQKEHGHTPIAHELLLMLARADLEASDYRVLVVLLTHSYGHQRKHVEIRTREIAEQLGAERTTVAAALERLTTRRIVLRTQLGKRTDPDAFEVNKRWMEWLPAMTSPAGVERLMRDVVLRVDADVRGVDTTSSLRETDELDGFTQRVGSAEATSSLRADHELPIHAHAGYVPQETSKQEADPLHLAALLVAPRYGGGVDKLRADLDDIVTRTYTDPVDLYLAAVRLIGQLDAGTRKPTSAKPAGILFGIASDIAAEKAGGTYQEDTSNLSPLEQSRRAGYVGDPDWHRDNTEGAA